MFYWIHHSIYTLQALPAKSPACAGETFCHTTGRRRLKMMTNHSVCLGLLETGASSHIHSSLPEGKDWLQSEQRWDFLLKTLALQKLGCSEEKKPWYPSRLRCQYEQPLHRAGKYWAHGLWQVLYHLKWELPQQHNSTRNELQRDQKEEWTGACWTKRKSHN